MREQIQVAERPNIGTLKIEPEIIPFPVPSNMPNYLKYPITPPTSLQLDHSSKLRLLVIDDDAVAREVVHRALEDSGLQFDLTEMSHALNANAEIFRGIYDCVLLDYRFPTGNAFELFADVLNRSCDSRAPIVMLTGYGDEQIAATAIKQGAQDYLSKATLSPSTLRHAVEAAMLVARLQREMKKQNETLWQMSLYDSLTHLPNRNLFFSRLDQKIKECERRNESFALLMMDLVGFKKINDTLGHDVGDEILRLVAFRMSSAIRQSDTIARIGGDEFACIISAGEDGENADAVALKLWRTVEEPAILESGPVKVGLSLGIAIFPRDGDSGAQVMKHADMAMYAAKRSGNIYLHHGDNWSDRRTQ